MKSLYLDCFSGISGNMFVGMLLQCGVPFAAFKDAMASLGLTGYAMTCEPVVKTGIQALYYDVILAAASEHRSHGCGEHHEPHTLPDADAAGGAPHGHHSHRGLKEIEEIIHAAPFSATIKMKSTAVFRELAGAEAKVHGTSPYEVHFHEVGAIDCILDIVGTIWCLDYLGIEQIGTSPLHVGSGFVRCVHGLMPVPAPATAELLTGLPYYSTTIKGELVTPTGAALVRTLAVYSGPRPKEFIHTAIAYGAGTKNLEIPNVLRGFVGECGALKP